MYLYTYTLEFSVGFIASDLYRLLNTLGRPGVLRFMGSQRVGHNKATELNWICGSGLVAKLCPTLVTPWTVACQAPLPMGFSRQECWSGLPFSSPGNQQNMQFFPNLFCSRFFFFFKEVSHCINAPRNKVKQIFWSS